MISVNPQPSLNQEFAVGVPASPQAPRNGKFWLRHRIPRKSPAAPVDTKPIAPYSEPGKGVGGESTNSVTASQQNSTWNTQGQDRIK